MLFVAGIFSAAGIFANQITGAVEQALKFLFAVELRYQRLPDNFGFRAIQIARPAVQPVGKLVWEFQRQSLHDTSVTPVCQIDNTRFHVLVFHSRLCLFASLR
jgi:hypothetical protein